ncbi:MAG TPA: hypothetical protein VFP54_01015 [Acidimicrobiales bacterium]|nr:hypothetical protein [Acidimicrobiales bacterium]
MDLIEVHLIGLPVAAHSEAAQHSDEVMREFSHLAEGADPSHVPARLLALNQTLQQRYAAYTQATEDELSDAVDRGLDSVDLTFSVPPDAAEGARALGDLLDEVDEYCEAGEYLLTLKTPPAALAYRRWFLGEFVRQAAGEPPTPWPEWAAQQ